MEKFSAVKSGNIYAIEKRGGRWVAKFVGEIEVQSRPIRRAAEEVSRQAKVILKVRDAQTERATI